ncbi:Oxidoreductase molybdopterin binding domain family protein [Brugia pahangi]
MWWLYHMITYGRLTRQCIVTTVCQTKIATTQYHSLNNHSKLSLISSENRGNNTKRWIFLGCFGVFTLAGGLSVLKNTIEIGYTDGQSMKMKIEKRNDLPTYRMDEVKKHGKDAQSIWVTFQGGVYDITNFIQNHPGGDKILLAAGGRIDPYWNIYQQHLTQETLEILEELRIGNLDDNDIVIIGKKNENDSYENDPIRHPALIIKSEKPFNAETPVELIMDNFYTPNDLFYVRNHMPVPLIDATKHKLTIEGISIQQPFVLSLDDLKRDFTCVSVNATLQCAGNRRSEMDAIKKVQGLNWKSTAIGNAKWTGVRLKDVLIKAGINPNDKRIKHVIFRGADKDNEGNNYETSITFEKAMKDEVIIAYQMNDKDIPRDHGYPIRLIAPGIVGARQVKFLSTIILSEEESKSHWQRRDYRGLPPFIGPNDKQNFELVPSIQDYPCWRTWYYCVEVSIDGGETWQAAELVQDPDQDIYVKQPIVPIIRNRIQHVEFGIFVLLNNAWHHVPVEIIDD